MKYVGKDTIFYSKADLEKKFKVKMQSIGREGVFFASKPKGIKSSRMYTGDYYVKNSTFASKFKAQSPFAVNTGRFGIFVKR